MNNWAEAFPKIELEVHASDYPVDFSIGQVDLAVRYTRQPDDNENLAYQEIGSDRYLPMAQPDLL